MIQVYVEWLGREFAVLDSHQHFWYNGSVCRQSAGNLPAEVRCAARHRRFTRGFQDAFHRIPIGIGSDARRYSLRSRGL